jgi:hypothetical protein
MVGATTGSPSIGVCVSLTAVAVLLIVGNVRIWSGKRFLTFDPAILRGRPLVRVYVAGVPIAFAGTALVSTLWLFWSLPHPLPRGFSEYGGQKVLLILLFALTVVGLVVTVVVAISARPQWLVPPPLREGQQAS